MAGGLSLLAQGAPPARKGAGARDGDPRAPGASRPPRTPTAPRANCPLPLRRRPYDLLVTSESLRTAARTVLDTDTAIEWSLDESGNLLVKLRSDPSRWFSLDL